MSSGLPRQAITAVSSRATLLPEIDVSAIAARHSFVTSSRMFRIRKGRRCGAPRWRLRPDLPALGAEASSRMSLTLQPVRVATGSDEDGMLVLTDEQRLVAVLTRLSEQHEGAAGHFYLEAGFGWLEGPNACLEWLVVC